MFTICSMVRDEQEYINEWIDYHLNPRFGISHIHLLNNGASSYKRHKNVTIESYRQDEHTTRTQADGFTAYAKAHQSEWTFYIDVDEFLVYDLARLNQYLTDKKITYIQSVFYNANGQRERTPGSVQDRFTQISPYQDNAFRYIKCLVNNADVDYFKSAHECILKGERKMRVAPNTDTIYLKHYFTKSYEEWRGRHRGDGWVHGDQCSDEIFMRHNPGIELRGDGI